MTNVNCPICGAQLSLIPSGQSTRNLVSQQMQRVSAQRQARGGMRNYHRGAAAVASNWAVDNWAEISFEEPARSASKEADVVVPLLQSLITGGIAALFVGSVAGGLAIQSGWSWHTPLLAALAGGAVVTSIMWSNLLSDTRSLLRKIETYTQRDLDGDGVIGEPARVSFEVRRHEKQRHSTFFSELPISEESFTTWARAAVAEQSISQDSWTGSRGLFSRSEYEELLDFLTRAWVIRWINPQAKAQGRVITNAGKAALRTWLEGK
ncbi:MAG: hypothetical protein K8R89_03620 [Anaerolineae bacterium]|nr:hypothetical protein [Anaerolineae bacterium]